MFLFFTLVFNLFTFLDPLEQFEIACFLCGHNSRFGLFLYIVLSIFIFTSYKLDSYKLRPEFSVKKLIIETLVLFIHGLCQENLKTKYSYFLNNMVFLFSFILISNLIGMFPYTVTVTSAFVLTFFLSFQFFFGLSTFAVLHHRSKVLGFFLPSGVPLLIAPFLAVIELISYLARVLSLAIRLFANIMAGHSLLKILAGFFWSMSSSKFWFFAILPGVVIFLVTFLEGVIAFLQAYVFVTLVIIYLNDAVVLH